MRSQTARQVFSLTLQVGEFVLQLRCEDALAWHQLAERYGPFRVSTTSSPHLVADLVIERPAAARPAQEPVLSFRAGHLVLEGPGVAGWVAADERRGHLTLNTPYVAEQAEYFLRAACALVAFEAGGLLLHAAGVVHRGRTYLFFGHSGSGKTTVAGFARLGDRLLNDDLVVLSPHDDRWTAWATPFSSPPGAFNLGPCSAPVAALFRLVPSSVVRADPLDPAQAVAELVANAPVVSADPGRSVALLERCAALARQVPLYALHFRRDPSFWEVVDKAVHG